MAIPGTLCALKRLSLSVNAGIYWGQKYGKRVLDVVRLRFNKEQAVALGVTKLSLLDIMCADCEIINQLNDQGLGMLREEGFGWHDRYTLPKGRQFLDWVVVEQ